MFLTHIKHRCLVAAITLIAAAACTAAVQHPPTVATPADAAIIVVVRPPGLIASLGSVEFYFDGYSVGRISYGKTLAFAAPEGTHSIGLSSGSVALVLEPRKCYYFRIAYSANLAAGIERRTPTQAVQEDGAQPSDSLAARCLAPAAAAADSSRATSPNRTGR